MKFSTVLEALDPDRRPDGSPGVRTGVRDAPDWARLTLSHPATQAYHGPMKRPIVAAVGAMALAASLAFVWVDARREREFRRLIAVGDEAVASGQTFDAIEAFSGALTLKPDSMLARLKRGDTYRRRGEFAAALRDLDRPRHSTRPRLGRSSCSAMCTPRWVSTPRQPPNTSGISRSTTARRAVLYKLAPRPLSQR